MGTIVLGKLESGAVGKGTQLLMMPNKVWYGVGVGVKCTCLYAVTHDLFLTWRSSGFICVREFFINIYLVKGQYQWGSYGL